MLINTSSLSNQTINAEIMSNKSNNITLSQSSNGDDLVTMIQRYVEYNHWANEQFAEWLANASEDTLNKEIESSFSTLQKTVKHIWGAEYLWLQVVKDESTDNSPAKQFEGTKEELLEGWLKASKSFSDHVKTMTLEELQAKRPRSRGEGFTVIVDMIHHCMNHSTYHRGQLITMGRQAGLTDPPRTDFIYYVGLSN